MDEIATDETTAVAECQICHHRAPHLTVPGVPREGWPYRALSCPECPEGECKLPPEDINMPWEEILSRARKGLDLITSKGYRDRVNPYVLEAHSSSSCPAAQVGNGSFIVGMELLGLDLADWVTCQAHGFLAEHTNGIRNSMEYALLTQAFKELLGA